MGRENCCLIHFYMVLQRFISLKKKSGEISRAFTNFVSTNSHQAPPFVDFYSILLLLFGWFPAIDKSGFLLHFTPLFVNFCILGCIWRLSFHRYLLFLVILAHFIAFLTFGFCQKKNPQAPTETDPGCY